MTVAGNRSRALLVAASPSPGAETALQRLSSPVTAEQFHQLYEITSGPILRYLLAITGRRHLAEDLLQETFVRLLAHPQPHLDLPGARRYLFRIATNLLRDRWRRADDAPHGEPPEAGYSLDLETSLHVRAALRQMKPRDRELLWLAYVEGMDHREIAAVTGLAHLSVRMLLSRARKRAGKLLLAGESHG